MTLVSIYTVTVANGMMITLQAVETMILIISFLKNNVVLVAALQTIMLRELLRNKQMLRD